jgi:hypothetical protein
MRIRIYKYGFSFYTIRGRIQHPRIFNFHARTMNMKNFLTIFAKFALEACIGTGKAMQV